MVSNKEPEWLHGKIVQNIAEVGLKISFMDRVNISGLMEVFMRDFGNKERWMAAVYFVFLGDLSMLGSLKMIWCTVMVTTNYHQAKFFKDFGNMANS
jgi:hypothetical protein